MAGLNVELYGPADGDPVLALHGVTGHGKRWADLAAALPDARIIAPDLLGHGFSTWEPPWSIDAHVAALADVVEAHASSPVVLVGHSFGGALALHLSRLVPDHIRSLVLLDPAIGLEPARLMDIATSYITHHDYPDEAAARTEKLGESWAELPPELLDREVADHLTTAGVRMSWRVHPGTVVTTWSELARPFVLPPPHMPVDLVQALRVQPPYVTADLLEALAAQQGELFSLYEEDYDHMVPFARPELTARLVAEALARARTES
ncbi:alpha/beta fold hydrolase [Williamsia muralis]|uniref:alpha/beta fold hydrolase n=1 Tax=Williamsia marianensis TaxID=85044 RepID=UPI000DE5D74E|nr:alpha/beta hydrolase [Williamsia marianensis]PVY34296.1 lipase [Williamsia marianensis]